MKPTSSQRLDREALDRRIAALVATAKAWQDPGHPPRAEAVEATLAAPNRFTAEALAFAINQHMHQLASPKKLHAWTAPVADRASAAASGGSDATENRIPVGIVSGGAVPLEAARAVAAVWLGGHVPVVRLPASSPYLLRAFAENVAAEAAGNAAFTTVFAVDDTHLLTNAEALMVLGSAQEGEAEDGASWKSRAVEAGMQAERVWLAPRGLTVAIVDGTEDFDERIGLAEDVLLHEGLSEANVSVLWAPASLDPDPYFEALSGFRQIMPAHPDTEGILEMPRAFLKAADLPYAWGDGMLVSRGDPEAQTAAHLRWSEYGTPETVTAWLRKHQDSTSAPQVLGVVATQRVAERFDLPEGLRIAPGNAHRQRLSQDSALAVFVAQL